MTATALDTLLAEAAELARAEAAEADRTGTPADHTLSRYGELGALRLGVADGRSTLADVTRLLETVGAECLSSAFSLWAHRMVVEYLVASGRFHAELEDLLAGRRCGSIAMATAMQELAGVGAIPTRATPTADGYVVHGRIAWASNIGPGTIIVFPARVVAGDGSDTDERVILTTSVGARGLGHQPVTDLLALGATRSAMLHFDGVHVPAEAVVATSLEACGARRTAHLLLQSAFSLGLAGRSMAEAAGALDGPGSVLAAQHERLAAQHRDLTRALHDAAADPGVITPRDVTVLRYDAARLALAAARHEATLVGGRGYVTTHATNRRLREASFLPVQSPSEVQLLQELERFGVYPTEGYAI